MSSTERDGPPGRPLRVVPRPDTLRKWREMLLRSPLTPADKLTAVLAAEGVTAGGDIPLDYAALGKRLAMAPRTVRYHLDAVRAAGWLSEKPSIYQASTRAGRRPPHYRAKIPNPV